MKEKTFNPMQFYSSYPSKVIGRPGYPARAAFKSALLFNLFSRHIFSEIDKISSYADIGGCFGFGANAMGFHIAKRQGTLPKIMVFEMASKFVNIGKVVFPHIEFIESEFHLWNGDIKVFDLVTLFDVVEHVVEPESFLKKISARCRYVMIKIPMETSGEWRTPKPPVKVGEKHPDGHINFFLPKKYEDMLNIANFDLIDFRLIDTIISSGAEMALVPETIEDEASLTCGMCYIPNAKKMLKQMMWSCLPFQLMRKIFGGGEHLCLCRSRLFN